MSKVNDNYEQVFNKLYKSGVYSLHADFDSFSPDKKHYVFEVTRRFLDVCRVINKNWPNTARYITAIHGDAILEEIYAHIFDSSDSVESLDEAIYFSAQLVIAGRKCAVSSLLLKFERENADGKIIQIYYDSLDQISMANVSFSADFDFLNFYHTVDYYRRTSAPPILFRHIKLIKRETYAVYSP